MEPAQALLRMLAAPLNVITNYGPAITNAAAKGLKRQIISIKQRATISAVAQATNKPSSIKLPGHTAPA